MSDGKILLYYKMTPLSDPEAIKLWQKTLCDSLGLTGRILISKHGLNGTVGGTLEDCKRYVKATRQYPAFHDIAFKWSDGSADDFPKMSVKVRDEIVTFTVPDEVQVDENGVVGGGVHLKPAQVNKLVEERGDEVVFFDGRNAMEAQIGKFKNAIVPDVETTRDFIEEIESGKYDDLKDKPVVTYCTGGIRCEILSTLMKNRGFKEIYQIDGGIVRYGEKFGNSGLWEGSMYIFDRRMHHEFGEGVEDPEFKQLGHCVHCDAPTNTFHNCVNSFCRKQTLLCDNCAADPMLRSCDKEECKEVAQEMAEAEQKVDA